VTRLTFGLWLEGPTRVTRDPEDDERDGVRCVGGRDDGVGVVGLEGRTLRVGVRVGAGLVFGGEVERVRVVDEETLRGGGEVDRVGVLVVGVALRVSPGDLGGWVVRDASTLRECVGAAGVLDVSLVAGDVRTDRPVTLRSAVEATTRRFLSAGTLAAASRSIRTLRTVALREDAAAAVRTLRERAPEANLTRPWPRSRVTARARALTFVGPWTSGPRITRRGA